MSRVKLFLGSKSLNRASQLYHHLDELPMKQKDKKIFILETCKNGWEYFVQ